MRNPAATKAWGGGRAGVPSDSTASPREPPPSRTSTSSTATLTGIKESPKNPDATWAWGMATNTRNGKTGDNGRTRARPHCPVTRTADGDSAAGETVSAAVTDILASVVMCVNSSASGTTSAEKNACVRPRILGGLGYWRPRLPSR